MASHNPNTKYGRRKNREEAQRNIDNYSEDEKWRYNIMMGCSTVILLLIAAVVIIIKNSN